MFMIISGVVTLYLACIAMAILDGNLVKDDYTYGEVYKGYREHLGFYEMLVGFHATIYYALWPFKFLTYLDSDVDTVHTELTFDGVTVKGYQSTITTNRIFRPTGKPVKTISVRYAFRALTVCNQNVSNVVQSVNVLSQHETRRVELFDKYSDFLNATLVRLVSRDKLSKNIHYAALINQTEI